MTAGLARWHKQEIDINGIQTVVLAAGEGEPLVYLHGASVFPGFDYQLEWADGFRVVIPYHPGFGESADDPNVSSVQDYVLHYAELFERLGLKEVNLVGHSLGGWIAATFATQFGHMLRKLVLIGPAGLRDRQHPTTDIFRIPSEQLPPLLVEDMRVLEPHLPKSMDVDFVVERFRESTSLARVAWERMYDLHLPRYLYRVRVPTLLVWGDADRIVPVGQADTWRSLIPGAEVCVLPGVGHLVVEESALGRQRIAKYLAS